MESSGGMHTGDIKSKFAAGGANTMLDLTVGRSDADEILFVIVRMHPPFEGGTRGLEWVGPCGRLEDSVLPARAIRGLRARKNVIGGGKGVELESKVGWGVPHLGPALHRTHRTLHEISGFHILRM